MADGACLSSQVCQDGLCQQINSDGSPVLNFKVTLVGIRVGSSCANNITANLVVKAVGESKVYNNVPLTKTQEIGTSNFAIYTGTKVLTGFSAKTGVAVFLKGMKHLQMKYGVDGQSDFYGREGGEINLTDSAKVQDFSKYPMLTGDVDKNGVINGKDFSEIITATQSYASVVEGDANSIYDLDGNCGLNTMDIGWLTKSLDVKYGELY
jgi:hypothetical protein